MSIESKIDVLAAAINRLADALNSKCSSSCHQTGAEVKPDVAPEARATPLETVLTVTAADVKSAVMNVIDESVKPAKAKKEPVAARSEEHTSELQSH